MINLNYLNAQKEIELSRLSFGQNNFKLLYIIVSILFTKIRVVTLTKGIKWFIELFEFLNDPIRQCSVIPRLVHSLKALDLMHYTLYL